MSDGGPHCFSVSGGQSLCGCPGSGEQKVVRTSVHMIVPICLSAPWLEFYLPEYSPSQGLNSRQQGMGGAGTVIVLYCKCSRG